MNRREIGEIVGNIKDLKSFNPALPLTWAQKAACGYLGQDMMGGFSKLYVNQPTGTGKGAIFLSILERLYIEGRLPRALIMTDTRLLANDLMSEACIFAPTLSRSGALGSYTISDGKRQNRVMISTYASGVPALEDGIIDGKDLMVIQDEGHLALSALRRRVFSNPDLLQLAFTASPSYYKTKSLDAAGYKPSFILSREEAVKTGLICGVRNIVLEVLDSSFSLDDIKLNSSGDYDTNDLDRVLRDDVLSQTVADFYTQWVNPETGQTLNGKSYIAFCNSVDHANSFAIGFNTRIGDAIPREILPCAPVWGHQNKTQKDWVLEGHKKQTIKGLSSVDYLIHGHNDPKIEVIFNMRPTRSAVVADQRAGRAMRLDHANPDKIALIVDIVYPGRKQPQLLFSDVAGGALFTANNDDRPTKNSVPVNNMPVFNPPLDIKVIYDAKEVLAWRKIRDAESVTGRFLSAASMPVRRAMLAKGITTKEAFERSAAKWLINNKYDERLQQRRGISVSALSQIVTNERDAIDEKNALYTPAAAVLAGMLGKLPAELFGSLNKITSLPVEEGFNHADDFPVDFEHLVPEEDLIEGRLEQDLLKAWHENATDPGELDDHVYGREVAHGIREELTSLNPRHERVVRERAAIGVEEQRRLTDIANGLNVTRERARQMYKKSLTMLRENNRVNALRTGIPPVDHRKKPSELRLQLEWIQYMLTLPTANLRGQRDQLLLEMEVTLTALGGSISDGLDKAGIGLNEYAAMKYPDMKDRRRVSDYAEFSVLFSDARNAIYKSKSDGRVARSNMDPSFMALAQFCTNIGLKAGFPAIRAALASNKQDALWYSRRVAPTHINSANLSV